jgi:hypothetical protein
LSERRRGEDKLCNEIDLNQTQFSHHEVFTLFLTIKTLEQVREINPQTHLLGANSGISLQENLSFYPSRKRKKERENL